MRSCSLLVAFASCLLSAGNWASVQTASQPAGAENSHYVVRIQHVQEQRDFCVLIRSDGQYHWELHLPDRAKIYEGALDQAAGAELNKILNTDEFRNLKQEKIVPPLAVTEIDRLLVVVARAEGGQKFEFFDKPSREPFRDVIAPLLGWLDWLRNQPHNELSEEEGRNNCLPPKDIALKRRPLTSGAPAVPTTAIPAGPTVPEAKTGTSPSPTSAPLNPYLMRVIIDEVSGEVLKRTCVVIYPDARYRMEKGSQTPGGRRSQVFQDSLTPEALQQLQQILDDPTLRNSPPPGDKNYSSIILEGDFTTLWLPDSNGVKKLQFRSDQRFGPGSSHISRDNTKPFKPLRQWLKSTVEGKKKIEPLKDAIPNDCAPRH